MFGRQPQLPVDLLLGTSSEELSGGSVEEWIQEHQDNLNDAYGRVRERLQERLERRNLKHHAGIRDAGFQEGELVYLKNHQVRGRNKNSGYLGLMPLSGSQVSRGSGKCLFCCSHRPGQPG